MITLHEQGGIRMNEELWYCVMSICFVLTMIATVIECGIRGIGIGLVRFLAGTALGLVAGGSFVRSTPGSRSDLYLDPRGNTYRKMPNGTVIRDRDGERYMITDEDG